MSDKGIGVMLHMLFGDDGESARAVQASVGKDIETLELNKEANSGDGALIIGLKSGRKLMLYDDGRSCCESRYMHTDDDLGAFLGALLLAVEVKDAPNVADEYGVHEVQFLVVTTSKGMFTVETHNEHNGYYGGFWLVARIME